MNAAKQIRRLIESGENPEQVEVLKELAGSLELGRTFDLKALYEIDMRYFDLALEMLRDWRFDHHIASRSKLLEQLLIERAVAASKVDDAAQSAEPMEGQRPRSGD
ncbi:hypothetical protein [Crenobacter cavernae]|uniref:Uncharacterized protein n=1 Tax=Crenobacter cavernae TaxID=2290923 RepID=A0ABY0FDK3_9NEIS|nr:hypothetical protein [Crenobacter cavernae]RXZ44179.1 hypothetical protein EBB06_06475 [Crenobacter cavernae]